MVSVLQVCTFYNPLGGIESAIRELVSGIKSDCNVEVLCTRHGRENKVDWVDDVKVTSVGSVMSVTGRPLAHQFPLELLKKSPDIMHYHLPFPLGAASHLLVQPKTKLVVTFHCDIIRYSGFKKIFEPFMHMFLKRCDAIAVTSENLIDATPILSQYKDKCHVIPYGVDASRYASPRQDRVAALKEKYGEKFILFVGRLAYYKGLEVLIQAMKQVDYPLVIVGDGQLDEQLRAQVKEEGLENRIHFAGPVYDESLIDLYHASELFVLPSTSAAEAFGLVQVEAMLAGKPVINTALPTGVPSVSLHGETGLTVPPNDQQALTNAINALMNDDSLRLKFGQEARRRALENFTSEKYVSNMKALYRSLCAKEAPAKKIPAAAGKQLVSSLAKAYAFREII